MKKLKVLFRNKKTNNDATKTVEHRSNSGQEVDNKAASPVQITNTDLASAPPSWTNSDQRRESVAEEQRLIAAAVEAEASSYTSMFCPETFYNVSGSESEEFQLIVHLLQNAASQSNEQSLFVNAKAILDATPAIKTQTTGNGCTLLHLFVLYNKDYLVSLVLNNGSTVLQKDLLGRLPLHFAAASNNSKAIELLMEAWRTSQKSHRAVSVPSWINSPDTTAFTPLHYACENLALQAVKKLINIGANLTAQDDQGLTPLHVAIKQVDDETADGSMRACLHQIIDLFVKTSKEQRLSPNVWEIQQEDGLTPIEFGRRNGLSRNADYIVERVSANMIVNTTGASAPPLTASIAVRIGANFSGSQVQNGASSNLRNECCICVSQEINCLLEPCSHLVVCFECATRINDCPICRQHVISKKKVYLS